MARRYVFLRGLGAVSVDDSTPATLPGGMPVSQLQQPGALEAYIRSKQRLAELKNPPPKLSLTSTTTNQTSNLPVVVEEPQKGWSWGSVFGQFVAGVAAGTAVYLMTKKRRK